MKLRTLTFIAGAIALSLTAAPYSAHAQANNSSPLLIAQTADSHGDMGKALNLTPDQKKQIQQLRHNEHKQIRQKLNIPKGQKINYKSLTPEQKQTVRELHKETRKNIYKNVLSNDQRQQADAYRKAHPHHHQKNQ